MKLKSIFIAILLLAGINMIISCSGSQENEAFDTAESLMETHPDSALSILKGVDKSQLKSKAARARYALLMSMALDKNVIDTTTFDVLQPAIDHYLKKGSPDEKLRTYYYQGCIFLNKGDKDNALKSFIKGLDEAPQSKDSLCIARTLVAQGGLYYEFHDLDDYMHNYLEAAKIYREYSYKPQEFNSLLNALNGAILLEDESRTDSLLSLFDPESLSDDQLRKLKGYKLSHISKFGSKEDVSKFISNQDNITGLDINGYLNLAYAYNKTRENNRALQMLNAVDESGLGYDTLKYLSISVSVLKDLGDFKGAFDRYWDFSYRIDSINESKFEQKAQSMEEKHEMELQAKNDSERKTKIIWGCVGGIVILAMGVCLLVSLMRSNKTKRDLAVQKSKTTELENERLRYEKDMAQQNAKIIELENEKLKADKDLADREAKNIQLENDKLKAEKERLDLKNKNLQLEMKNKALEAENLAHRVEALENESESLKKLLENHNEIPDEVRHAIRIRIDMLNSLLASHISDNKDYEKPYDTLVKELTENTNEFMNSNRLAFQMSYPRFIRYFEEHGLTIDEINYICLYAIGLRGKEVGNYMKKRSHVNISSAIRQKLGIDKHETNIGIYVRKLLKEL